MPTLEPMPGKQKGKGGQGKRVAKPSPAKSRKGSRAETDRSTEPEFDQADDEDQELPDHDDESPDPGPRRPDLSKLTAKQRDLVEALVRDPDRCQWQAAWRAGYCGGSPDAPLPEAKAKRQALGRTASEQLAKPRVKAYLDELEARAVATWLGSPEAAEVREAVAARETGEAELDRLAAKNLAVMVALAHHDPRSAVQWGPGWVSVTASDQLSYEESLLILEVHHKEWSTEGGANSETRVKLADRHHYVKLLEQRVGKRAPVRHEISGPGGAPIEHSVGVEVAPDADLLEECAAELLGVVPASVSEQEQGLAPDEVVAILKGWADDPEPHVGAVHELFEGAALEESRARYLGED